VRHVAALAGSSRAAAVLAAIAEGGGGKSLVFGRTRGDVDQLAAALPRARALHGGLAQARETEI
jgi:hypothetical protein